MSAFSTIALNATYGYTNPASTGFYGFGIGSPSPTFPLEPKTSSASSASQPAPQPTSSSNRTQAVTTLDQIQDQVQVSKAAEARLLYSQGQSLSEIENTLGIPSADLTSYLDLTNGTETLTQVATATVAAQTASATAAAA